MKSLENMTSSRSSGMERDALARDRFANLTCPSCLGTLRVKAHENAEGPCPICSHPLKYVAPVEAPVPAPAFVPRQRINPSEAPAVTHTHAPLSPEQEDRRTARALLGQANEFLNSTPGILLSWAMVAVLVSACGILFFSWNKERRAHSLRMEVIESQRPPASRPVDPATAVPLLPGETPPAPAQE